MSTDFFRKCLILSEVHAESSLNPELTDFRNYNDIGLPLAYLVYNEMVDIKDESKRYIDETYDMLCKGLGIDPEVEYVDFQDMVNAWEQQNPDKVEE